MHNAGDVDDMIAKAATGDAAAMQSLLMRHYDALLSYLRKLLADRAVTANISAEDALQDTMIEAFRRIKTLEPRGEAAFVAWLMTIARTRLSNTLKAQRAAKRGGGRRRVVSLGNQLPDQTITTILGFIAADTPTPSLILRRKEAAIAAQDALELLEPLKKQVMEMRYGQGLSIDTIAEAVGKKPGAVKMLIHRCLAELRATLEKNGQITRGV